MARVSARWVGAGVVAAARTVWLVDWTAPPAVDGDLAAAMLPAIDDALEQGPWPGLLSTARPELEPRWFCVERVIKIRRPGDHVTAAMAALCEEYARDGTTLLTGGGERAAKVVDLVAGVDAAPDGPIRDWWLAHGVHRGTRSTGHRTPRRRDDRTASA